MRRTNNLHLISVLLTFTTFARAQPATQPAPPSLRVRVARVMESRHVKLDKDGQRGFQEGVQIYLQITPLADMATATGYGRWQVDTALDEHGQDVGPMALPYAHEDGSDARHQAERYADIDPGATEDLKPGPDGFCSLLLKLQLGEVPRASTQLARLNGHVDLTLGGQDYVARFSHLPGHFGETLSDDRLRREGVSLTLEKPDPKDAAKPSSIVVQLHGDPNLFHDNTLDIVGRDGKTLVTQSDNSGLSSELIHAHTMLLSRPVDDAMVLTVRLRTGVRTVRVPFNLTAIALP